MAQIIYLHKQRPGPKAKPRSFMPTGREATILMYTGVRYERAKPDTNVAKSGGKRITGR